MPALRSGDEAAVPAAVVEEWRALARVSADDLADEDRVVTRRVLRVDAALDPCERVVEDGRARHTGRMRDALELLRDVPRGEAAGKTLLVGGEHVDRECAGVA